jgi:thiamine-phosphate pyrophosphorylase
MIVITDPELVENEINVINALFNNGLDVLHLRKPDYTKEQMADFISEIDSRFHSQIMIHDHYELINEFQLMGIHFTGKTKHLLPYFNILECKKSISVHDLDELEEVGHSVDYIFLCPVYPSVSKKGYSKEWNFEAVKQVLAEKHHFYIVALGGITLTNAKQIRELGFHDFAVLGSVWEPLKSGYSNRQMIDIFHNFRGV